VGEILDSTFRIFSATLVKCLPYAILAVILGQLPNLYDLLKSGRPRADLASRLALVRDPVFWLMYLVGIVLTLLFTNAIVLRQCTLASGREAAASAELRRGAVHVPGVIVIAIVLVLAVIASLVPVFIIAAALGLSAGMARGLGQPAAVGAVIAFYLLVLVAVSWVLIRWVSATPIYLLTERGPLASLSHSWRLTAGSFWRLSVIYAVAVVLLIVFYFLAAVVGTAVAAALAHGDLAVMTAVLTTVVVVLGAIAAPFYSALMLAVYGDLSVRREGTDLAQRIAAAE
jgi:hypothetical protein